MKTRAAKAAESPAVYYDRHGVLGEIIDKPVEIALDEELRRQILDGRRSRRL